MGALAILAVFVAGAEPVRLAAPSFSVSGVEPAAARVWSDTLAQELTRAGLIIQTEADLAAALGIERQRQLMGCSEDPCRSELAGALGSDGLLLGSVSLAGETRVVNVRIVSRAGQPLASASASAPDDAGVTDALEPLARDLVSQLRPKLEAGRVPEERAKLLKGHSLWPGLLGGLCGAAGIAMVSIAAGIESGIRGGSAMYANAAELDRAIGTGRTLERTGWVVIGLGLALALTAIAFVVFGEGR